MVAYVYRRDDNNWLVSANPDSKPYECPLGQQFELVKSGLFSYGFTGYCFINKDGSWGILDNILFVIIKENFQSYVCQITGYIL